MVRRSLLIALVAFGAVAAPAQATVTVDSPSAKEGEILTFTVTSDELVPVTVSTSDGTATAGDDYTSRSTLVASGETKIEVQTTDDAAHEANETVVLTAGSAQGTGTILDDDPPAFAVQDVSVAENARTARLELTASEMLRTVDVDFATADGSARAGSDFTATSGRLTFAPGERTRTVDVPITDDATDEDDEAFTVTFATGGRTVASAKVTVTNDDLRLLSIGDVGVTEGDGANGVAVVPISLNAPTFRTVTVRWSTYDDTARAPGDFLGRLATVTIPPGQRTVTATVPIVSDDVPERSEAFGVGLANAQNARIAKAGAFVTITDDDAQSGANGDTTAPRMRLGRPGRSSGRTVKVLVGCPKREQRCRGRVTLFARPDHRRAKLLRTERRIGAKSFSLPGQATQTLHFTVPAALFRAAEVNRRLRLSAYLVGRDDAGNVDTRVSARTVRVTPARKRSRR